MKKNKDLILVLTLVVTSAAVYFYFHKGINKAEIKKALLESPGLKGMLVKVDEGEQLSSDKLNQQENFLLAPSFKNKKGKLPKLSILDLMNCEVTSVDGYRETMFTMLPQLKYLDNADKDGGKNEKNFDF